ncbi:MAG TPA: hypothetical protein VLY83_01905 [Methanoregula sp.]|nr:hypothetical protein [Methanoregula sp.]
MTGPGEAKRAIVSAAALAGIALLLICAGCTSQNPAPAQPAPTTTDTATFIAAANDCRDMNMTITGAVGTFTYSSTSGCVFIKTLDRLNASETAGMKTMLEGKNMSCSYTKGNFDPRLVSSLVGGMEYCNGELKDKLAELIVFT